jgi:two-component system KDP operon response regulator KdpE
LARPILLIDDDPDIRTWVRELLVDEGFVVHTANDGQHALQVLERIMLPGVILLDYKMPVMDGRQFLTAMRRNTKWQAIPVVILSAQTREWSGARLEVADILTKPLDIDLLLSTVQAICGDGVQRRQA